MKNPSICFVIPYFGSWPFWMPFYLQSCKANSDINWLIYTDCPPVSDCPPNVCIKQIGYDAYCARVSAALQIDFRPEHPYKLCDLKPALGFIHQDELERFDFWAFGDLDVIYGNIRAHYTAGRLRKKDLYSTHERRISGHFCLIRNTHRMRTAFMRIPRWQERLVDEAHHALDEGAFSRIFIRHKNFPKPIREAFGLLNPWRRRSEFTEAYSTPGARVPWLDGSNDFPNRWFWRAGVLTNEHVRERDFPYFHFMVWKKLAHFGNSEAGSMLEEVVLSQQWEVSAAGFSGLRE